MIKIKHNRVILEMDRNDLWQLGTALINFIKLESQKKWIHYYKGNSEDGFLRYVHLQHHVIFLYIEEIYDYLERQELLISIDNEIIDLFRQFRSN